MSSVRHRPQCNIGPGISPVTISTMDDSRKRSGSPGLASSTRRRRANDEMNGPRILGATTAAVVVVTAVTSSVTHTMLASDIKKGINERSRRLNREEHCEDFDERGPDCFKRQYRMPRQTFDTIRSRLYPVVSGVSWWSSPVQDTWSHHRCCGRSGGRHVKRYSHHARFRYQEGHQREESSPRLGGALQRPRRTRPRLF